MSGTKFCPVCQAEADSNAVKCQQCTYDFRNEGPGLGARRTVPAASNHTNLESAHEPTAERPDGSTPMLVGWGSLGGSLLFFIAAAMAGPEYNDTAYDAAGALAVQWTLLMLAGGFFSLFLVFWSVGYIVKAISFLPTGES